MTEIYLRIRGIHQIFLIKNCFFASISYIDMSKKVIENLAVKYTNVTKGVTSVMGGKVLEYEAKTILREGIQEGEKIILISLVRDGILKASDAAERLGITEEELRKDL